MLEVVFDDSALGSMRQAFAGGSAGQEGTALYGSLEGERELTPEEEARLQEQTRLRQQEEAARQRRGWAESLQMEGAPSDILSFPLCLSVGEIREEGIGPQRQAALESLMGHSPEAAQQVTEDLLERSRQARNTLLARAGTGEAVRVWTSNNPDDACGLAWLAQQLSALGLETVQVIQVKLPDFYEQSDGTVLCWQGWGEVEPWLRWASVCRSTISGGWPPDGANCSRRMRRSGPCAAGSWSVCRKAGMMSFSGRRSRPKKRNFQRPMWWAACLGSTSWA